MSEGIYDLDDLLLHFPGYKAWFIAAAFGDRDTYAESSVTSLPVRSLSTPIRWMVIHSKGDTLVNRGQSEALYDHLSGLGVSVQASLDQFEDEHDEVLQGDQFVQVVGDFIRLS